MENISTMQRRAPRTTYTQAIDTTGMVPPQAVELEKSVLGALMLDQNALYGTIDNLHEGLFYKGEHQAIFSAIRMLVNCSHEVDMLTVVEELRREGKLEQAGGAYYVSKLTENVVSAAHIDFHSRILAEKYIQREVIRTSLESIREAYDETCDPIELLDKSQRMLMEISENSFKKKEVSLDAIMSETQATLLSGEQQKYSIPSGFVDLDSVTSGFKPGALIILAARPGMGKTAFGLNLARNIAVDFGKPVAYFSLEMTGVELVSRLLSSEAMVEGKKLQRPDLLTKYDRDRLAMKMTELRKAPIYIDDTAGLNLFDLKAKCRRLQQKHGIKMVFIDYLQLMGAVNDGNRTRNREQELAIISGGLKMMAKELKIPVLAMAQFNRKAEDRPMGIPIMSDIRDSGAIEQDADLILALHRPEACGIMQDEFGNSTHGQASLIMLKHRAGERRNVELLFEGRYTRFSSKPHEILNSRMNDDIKSNTNFDNAGPGADYTTPQTDQGTSPTHSPLCSDE